ncbi:MAG: hypothetical protein K9N51_00925, partial [Candidatus Pacebacteria bacterium]|nr:hypothetical protein [Candidatus Paceibacterota bacterium]
AENFAEYCRYFPDLRYVIFNTEHIWVWNMDFRPSSVARAAEQFNLDLGKWLGHPPEQAWKLVPPGGRLSRSKGGYPRPENGVVAVDDPLYAYLRWWHSDAAGNEIFLNDFAAAALRETCPWVKAIAEPALRRPPVRAFHEQDIIEEWYYYPNPATAIAVQEKLAAAARGSRARISGMPQFLLKPGMAAPYSAMPTPHMFRETVWHCIARPLSALTYWNLWSAIQRSGKEALTQEEIDERLAEKLEPGDKRDYDTVRSAIQVKGEWSEFRLFIPELKGEIGRLHNDIVHPLSALFSRWENRPRKIALYLSFAGQIFSEIRWPHGGPLGRTLGRIPLPYDVLFDQDFEERGDVLDGYRVLVIPEAPVITEPAADRIRSFIEQGGVVLVDRYFQAPIPGVTRFTWTDNSDADLKELSRARQELLDVYGRPDNPQFIEGMEKAAAALQGEAGPTREAAALIRESADPEVTTAASQVFLNSLQVDDTRYVVAVNDARVPGPHYGHFGRVLERGVPQRVELSVDASFGAAIYELLTCREVTPVSRDGRMVFDAELPPCGGRVFVLLPKAIGDITASAHVTDDGAGDRQVRVQALLTDVDGSPVPGVIPLEAVVTRPDSSRSSFSHHSAFVDGIFVFDIPIPLNAAQGEWRVDIRELASGRRRDARFMCNEDTKLTDRRTP